MSGRPAIQSSNQPLGVGAEQRRRFLFHHLPVAVASTVAVVLLMHLSWFDLSKYPHGDIFSGTFPRQRGEDHAGPMRHGGQHDHSDQMNHEGGHTGPMQHGGHSGPMRHGGEESTLTPNPEQIRHRSFLRQFTDATGYVALGLLALTLVIGPANFLLRRQNPVSNYLRRDVGIWTTIFSIIHVIAGLQVHGRGRISSFLDYFITPEGGLRLNSFGLGNWTGLVALLIAIVLLVLSNDASLRKFKAKPWKWLQRFNYALFGFVILHAFFYGALLRVTSPFTLLLGLSVAVVIVGQAVGIALWRRRYAAQQSQ